MFGMVAAACITHHFQLRERACHRLCELHVGITTLRLLSYCFCHHDWYAFMPFEYKIRDSPALHSRVCAITIFFFFFYESMQMRNLACATHFLFAVHLTGRCASANINRNRQCVNKRATPGSELKFKLKIHDSVSVWASVVGGCRSCRQIQWAYFCFLLRTLYPNVKIHPSPIPENQYIDQYM